MGQRLENDWKVYKIAKKYNTILHEDFEGSLLNSI